MTKYEITIELPNGDWVWKRCQIGANDIRDYHDMLAAALDYAFAQGGRVHHIEKLG